MPLTRDMIEITMMRGCHHPDCRDPNCNTLVLAQRCCPRRGQKAIYQRGSAVLHICCARCYRTIVDVALDREAAGEDLMTVATLDTASLRVEGGRIGLESLCHKGRPVTASYKKGSGIVELKCGTCEETFARLKLAETGQQS